MKRKKDQKAPVFVTMPPEQLVEIREILDYNQVEMAGQMETPVNTYRDWEAGRSRIPGAAGKCARLLLEKDRHWMAGIPARVAEEMERNPSLNPRLVK